MERPDRAAAAGVRDEASIAEQRIHQAGIDRHVAEVIRSAFASMRREYCSKNLDSLCMQADPAALAVILRHANPFRTITRQRDWPLKKAYNALVQDFKDEGDRKTAEKNERREQREREKREQLREAREERDAAAEEAPVSDDPEEEFVPSGDKQKKTAAKKRKADGAAAAAAAADGPKEKFASNKKSKSK